MDRPAGGRTSTDFRIGCSGWYYRHWHGPFYPRELPSHRWFEHYRRAFNTVELNAPFYRWPKPETVRRWKRDAHRNFVYAVKVNGLITHEKRFVGTRRLVRDFCSLAATLEGHFGAFLFQMPPSFRYSPARLRRILDQLDPRWTSVLEFRHRSWWNADAVREISAASAAFGGGGAGAGHGEAAGGAVKGGVVFCTTSGPRLPETLMLTGPDVYLRFHGPQRWYRHDYSAAELRPWAQGLAALGARRVFAYFNNDHDAYAIKNARSLKRLLAAQRRCGS